MSFRAMAVVVLVVWFWLAGQSPTMPGPVETLGRVLDSGGGVELAAGLDSIGSGSSYSGPRSGRLSAGEIAAAAHSAGFRGDALTMAVAVALAESAGDAGAVGDTGLVGNGWGPSYGLWQIRSRTEDTDTGRDRDARRLGDPAANATAAWSISGGGTNWGPWSAYTNGSYRAHLDTARAATGERP